MTALATSLTPTRPLAGRWLLTGLALPPAGWLATTVAGPVDRPSAALLGGAVAGAGLGLAQWRALRHHRVGGAWPAATAVGMAAGLALGAAAADYQTGTPSLVTMGAVTGIVVGAAQATVLHASGAASRSAALAWAVAAPVLFALSWFTTAAAGIDVERQYAVFGLSGALASAAVGGALLTRLLRRPRVA